MLYDFGTLGKDLLFIVMEYVQGECLRNRLRRQGWLPVPEALAIAKQVALGLAVAHEQGVVHRDVSPDNILMVTEGDELGEEVAKLIDFGIAKNVISIGNSKITGTMEIVGKAEYCSPEQIQPPKDPDEEELDGRSDIYSLGVSLYEMLTGERPFDAKTAQGYLAMHLKKPPRLMKDANPLIQVSPTVEGLVMGMLEKDRNDRPQSAEELFKELITLQHEMPVLTPIG
jgi:serine/threonine-protein kinase